MKIESKGLPSFYVYRGERGDYLVNDDVCTCKSFLVKVRKYEPCKHICSKKFAPADRVFSVDLDEYTDILISLIYSNRSLVLNLLIARSEGEINGEKKKEKEDHQKSSEDT